MTELIDTYLNDLTDRGSARTARNYRTYLRRFISMTHPAAPTDITVDTVDTFIKKLRAAHTNRAGLMHSHTINYHLIALRSFLNFLRAHNITTLDSECITLLKATPTSRTTLSPRSLATLLGAPLQHAPSPLIQARDAAILELLCSTGMKVSELARLKRDDAPENAETITVRGLRQTTRTIPLSNQARHRLQEYLKLRHDTAPALFIRHDAAHTVAPAALTPRSIQRMIKKYAHSAGLPHDVSPETLRQLYARSLQEHGEDTERIRQRLGHARIATTRRYTQ